MTTLTEIKRILNVTGEPRRSGKWLVWEDNASASSCRYIERELHASRIVGFARPGRGARISTLGVLAEQVEG